MGFSHQFLSAGRSRLSPRSVVPHVRKTSLAGCVLAELLLPWFSFPRFQLIVGFSIIPTLSWYVKGVYMEYRGKFSERLAILRRKREMSMASIGSELGVTDEAVRLLEKGKRSPSFEVLCSLADYFDVSLDYLVGRSDDPTRH